MPERRSDPTVAVELRVKGDRPRMRLCGPMAVVVVACRTVSLEQVDFSSTPARTSPRVTAYRGLRRLLPLIALAAGVGFIASAGGFGQGCTVRRRVGLLVFEDNRDLSVERPSRPTCRGSI